MCLAICWLFSVIPPVKITKIRRQYSGHNIPLGHHTNHSHMGLGQYECLGEYCGGVLPVCF